MKRSKFTEEQIIGILREPEAVRRRRSWCRRHGISSATFYAWKAKFGGMDVSDAKRLKALEEENGRARLELQRWREQRAALRVPRSLELLEPEFFILVKQVMKVECLESSQSAQGSLLKLLLALSGQFQPVFIELAVHLHRFDFHPAQRLLHDPASATRRFLPAFRKVDDVPEGQLRGGSRPPRDDTDECVQELSQGSSL